MPLPVTDVVNLLDMLIGGVNFWRKISKRVKCLQGAGRLHPSKLVAALQHCGCTMKVEAAGRAAPLHLECQWESIVAGKGVRAVHLLHKVSCLDGRRIMERVY
jgi:hypothetical protein